MNEDNPAFRQLDIFAMLADLREKYEKLENGSKLIINGIEYRVSHPRFFTDGDCILLFTHGVPLSDYEVFPFNSAFSRG